MRPVTAQQGSVGSPPGPGGCAVLAGREGRKAVASSASSLAKDGRDRNCPFKLKMGAGPRGGSRRAGLRAAAGAAGGLGRAAPPEGGEPAGWLRQSGL